MRELSPLFGTGTLEWVHITIVHWPVTHVTPLEGLDFFTINPSRTHVWPDRAAILEFAKRSFAKRSFFEANALCLYLSELLICVKGITEVVFYFVFSFKVKEGSKKGLKKERRPIANRHLLYQLSLLPHFLPHGATVTISLFDIKLLPVSVASALDSTRPHSRWYLRLDAPVPWLKVGSKVNMLHKSSLLWTKI